ncbi:BV6 family protein [Diolcogaster facetosa bracovirus]|uniref:BV6 family protein n=2 Tax=Bracoviriform TaxID=2946836 RepID=R9XLD9_9VIRU|nr:BV6 family protein [Diolcogaster facetosa bracovirus] [Bracoviriform facetosae]AGO14378.1 BV6 family protein [Diolcogaster facetosa bracovirus] [Bracoviriform facetosae]AGO14452.1 BV6 family protein [Cotesia sesamiae Mombasa bracovirus]
MSKHICLVPNEWSKYYSQDVLEVILKKDLSCDSISKKVEGAKININGTTVQLRYHGDQPWLRKDQDKRTFPNPRKYFGVYMSCNDCRKPKFVYFVSEICHITDKVGTSESTCKP